MKRPWFFSFFTLAAPSITSIDPPADGTYVGGDNLDFIVNWSLAVNVVTDDGTPTLTLHVGANTRSATYLSGSGTNALIFRYVIANEDLNDTNGIDTVSPLQLDGGTIKSPSEILAILTFDPPLTTGIKVDTFWGDGSDGTLSTVGDVTYDTDAGETTRQFVNLTVNVGHTITWTAGASEFYIKVKGNLVVDGGISVTGLGIEGAGVQKNIYYNGSLIAQRPAVGGSGGAAVTGPAPASSLPGGSAQGTTGTPGSSGGTGGGGAGAAKRGSTGGPVTTSGAGGAGTSSSGGSGGGAIIQNPSGTAPSGSSIGGAGGFGVGGGDSQASAGGGAGNPGGLHGGHSSTTDGEDGTGGVLIILVRGHVTISASALIQADGLHGGGRSTGVLGARCVGGGGSGGGRVIVIYGGSLTYNGTVRADGGAGGVGVGPNGGAPGGAGGAGTATLDVVSLL